MQISVQIGLIVLGGVLILVAIVGGKFKLFGAEISATTSNPYLRFIAFVFGTALIIISLQSIPSPTSAVSSTTSRYKLASEVLPEIGIAKRYDMHFDHLMGMLGNSDDFKLYTRFRKMFVQEIGWKHFEGAYTERLVTDFSDDELKELLNLSKQPVMKKLLQSEVKAYSDTSKQRFKMGFELWNNYNSGKLSLPPE